MNSALDIQFGGHALVLDASAALYWPEERILVASDLHLEKATFLAQHGSFIAPYDTLDTLERLEARIHHYQPRELLLLGDSFHDRHAWARLDISLRERITQLIGTVERSRWIEGNHDVVLLEHGLPVFEAAHVRGGILFTHEYVQTSQPQIIGHYHPKAHVSVRGHKVRGRCFLRGSNLMVMPAFGSFTGGLDCTHPALTALFAEPAQPYLLHKNGVYKL